MARLPSLCDAYSHILLTCMESFVTAGHQKIGAIYTKCIRGFKDLKYEERLQALGACTLKKERAQAHMIMVYNLDPASKHTLFPL